MHAIRHQEDGCGLRPRHPLVCLLDLWGALVASYFFIWQSSLLTSVLPVAIGLQYAVSCLYHWLPYNQLRQMVDRLLIAVLIAATYIQFLLCLLPASDAVWRIGLLLAIVAGMWVLRLLLPRYTKVHGGLYLVLGLMGLAISLPSLQSLSPVGYVGFLIGVLLYFTQFLVFALQQPDPLPKHFGYRELQHTILLAASTLHLIIATVYLSS